MDQEQETGVENERGKVRRRSQWWLWSLPLIGAAMGWFVMSLVVYVLPAKFESVAVVQIHGSAPTLDPFGGIPGNFGPDVSSRAEAFQTEFEILTAQQTLLRVVERLDLTSRWSMTPDNVLNVLDAVVESERVEGTDLVEIRVRHTNRQDARDIAEKVGEAYQERRVSMEMDRAHKVLNSLDGELRDQEDLVEEKRKVLDTIVQAIGIPYVEGQGTENVELMGAEDDGSAERELGLLEQEKVRLETEIKAMLRLKSDELPRYAPFLDSIPRELYDWRREYLIEKRVMEEMVKADMGDGGLELIRQRARVGVLKDEMESGVSAFREAMQTRLRIMESRVETARSAVSSRRDQAVDRSLESHDYVEARREYESAQAMLQVMKKQHSSQRIALKIPKHPITIHEKPREGKVPVSPDVDVYLTTGKLGGAAIGAALALMVAGVRRTRGRERAGDDAWAED